jgi:pimeloyl-ACP methyl ester carboxylesterase
MSQKVKLQKSTNVRVLMWLRRKGEIMDRPWSFVLVHGAWHGGWCWDRVRPFLEAANARIVAPTLSGLAEKAAKSASAPVLLDQINDVIAAVEDEQLSEVVLVGHSYAGMLITAAAEKLRSRLKHLFTLMPRFQATAMILPRNSRGSRRRISRNAVPHFEHWRRMGSGCLRRLPTWWA